MLDSGYYSTPAQGTVIYGEDYLHLLITNSLFEKHQRALSYSSYSSSSSLSSYHDGGVLYSGKFANITFINCNFNENDANKGGVAFVDEHSNVTFTTCTFKRNEAKSDGGVVYLKSNGNIEFHQCIADENSLTATTSYYSSGISAGDGSVLYSEGPGSVIVSNSSFRNNTAGDGCIYLKLATISLRVVNTHFMHNKAYTNGGAIYRTLSYSSTPTSTKLVVIKNCTFTNNVAGYGYNYASTSYVYNKYGGSLYLGGYTSNDVIITNTEFVNSVAGKGGAVYITRTRNVSISNCTFKQNQAKFGAGAIYFEDMHGVIIIDNTTFDENVAEKDQGGSLYAELWSSIPDNAKRYTHLVINNSTFTNNFAQKDGGGIYMKGYKYSNLFIAAQLENVIFKNNSATLSGGGIYSKYGHLIGSSLHFTENKAGTQVWWQLEHKVEDSGVESSFLKKLYIYSEPGSTWICCFSKETLL